MSQDKSIVVPVETEIPNIYAHLIGDELSSEEHMPKECIKLIKESNLASGVNPGYTTVELVTRKRIRIYHKESFVKRLKIEILPEGGLVVVKGFSKFEGVEDDDIMNGFSVPQCGFSDEDVIAGLGDKFRKGVDKLKLYDVNTLNFCQPIVVMPRGKIREIYEDDDIDLLANHLYLPTTEVYRIKNNIHPDGCRCKKCKS